MAATTTDPKLQTETVEVDHRLMNGVTMVRLIAEVDRDGVIWWWDARDVATRYLVDLPEHERWFAVSSLHRAIETRRAT